MREAAEQLLGWMESPEVRSWLEPLDGPSRALGAAIRGENPVVAAGDREAGTFGEALQEYGVPAWLAGAAEFLVPDPTGARKVTDLIPMLSIIGPAGIRALYRTNSGVQFIPAYEAHRVPGNRLRRTPEQQAEYANALRRGTADIDEAAIFEFDRAASEGRRIRYYLGEGNHRTNAAIAAGGVDAPLPARAIGRSYWPEEPRPGQRISTVAPNPATTPDPYGYVRADLSPSSLGLPAYTKEAVIEYALERARAMNISQAEIDEMLALIEKWYPPITHGMPLNHIPLPPGGF